ncbi:MAG: T9SS type A sorting domain-containing protein [Bacteroidetes bacterium]|nr:T9SS type A sorting domain-containing protein [Bacteroidota bacterium]
MKKILQVLSVCLFAFGGLNGQVSISIHPDDLSYNLPADLSDEYSEVIAHAIIVNTSNQSIRVRWVLDVPTADCISDWKYLVCDTNACYSIGVISNINPGASNLPNKSVDLAPGDTSRIDVHVRPVFVAGCCSPTVHFTEISDQNNPIDLGSATYDVCISPLSSTKEVSVINSLKAFPNPSAGEFSITDNPLVKKIVVFNLLGRQVASFQHTNGKVYNINNAPEGLYLVSMQDANGDVLKTVRMTKQDLRP